MITNDKPSYVAKVDSICLFSVAKKAALNKQQIKPCVPLLLPAKFFVIISFLAPIFTPFCVKVQAYEVYLSSGSIFRGYLLT